jgi:hypothetical protein
MGKSRKIGKPDVPASPTLSFSFKLLDADHEVFNITQCYPQFWTALCLKLREYSSWTEESFRDINHDTTSHRHPIHFGPETTESGFRDLDIDQLGYLEPWQFGVGDSYSSWRVHGAILDGVFYVIWLDTEHKLYARH